MEEAESYLKPVVRKFKKHILDNTDLSPPQPIPSLSFCFEALAQVCAPPIIIIYMEKLRTVKELTPGFPKRKVTGLNAV